MSATPRVRGGYENFKYEESEVIFPILEDLSSRRVKFRVYISGRELSENRLRRSRRYWRSKRAELSGNAAVEPARGSFQ